MHTVGLLYTGECGGTVSYVSTVQYSALQIGRSKDLPTGLYTDIHIYIYIYSYISVSIVYRVYNVQYSTVQL